MPIDSTQETPSKPVVNPTTSQPNERSYLTVSHGIARLPLLDRLLGKIARVPAWTGRLTPGPALLSARAVLGWGRRPGTDRAWRLAQRLGLPYLALEDGFLRSFGTGDHFPPLAIVQDADGIYYDSRTASSLEGLLNSDQDLCAGIEGDLDRALPQVVTHGLTKYNHAPDWQPGDWLSAASTDGSGRSGHVLVIDQTVGDMSVTCGGASAETFAAMLDAARVENPNATVFVKTHPEVTSGRKGGYLTEVQTDDRTVVLRDAINPASLLRHMDHVYVVSSTMGFEALLHGKPVSCFGVPWYAGWGVTDDRQACARRARARSVRELFAAAYWHYTTYVDPVTHRTGTIHDVMDWLIHQKQMSLALHGSQGVGRVFGLGFARWKAYNLKPMLGLKSELVKFVSHVDALKQQSPIAGDTVLVWGADVPADLAALQDAIPGLSVCHLEDGFVRSVGLGSDMIRPSSLVMDRRGIYFDPRQPSDLEHLLMTENFTEQDCLRARLVRARIVDAGLTKYNLDERIGVHWPVTGKVVGQDGCEVSGDARANVSDQNANKSETVSQTANQIEHSTESHLESHNGSQSGRVCVILVPGQVEDDASIRLGCTTVKTNLDLLRAVRAANPDAFVVYKPHPDVTSGNRMGKVHLNDVGGLADHVETEASVIDCIEACDEVHTMTSLTGFDALLRSKRVVTYGQPFYAGWGLTEDRCTDGPAFARRGRQLTIDELVAGVMLKYPLYWDWTLRGYTRCEAVVERLIEQRQALQASGELKKLKVGAFARFWRKLRVFLRAWFTRW